MRILTVISNLSKCIHCAAAHVLSCALSALLWGNKMPLRARKGNQGRAGQKEHHTPLYPILKAPCALSLYSYPLLYFLKAHSSVLLDREVQRSLRSIRVNRIELSHICRRELICRDCAPAF